MERLMLNGRFDGGDSGEKTVGSQGKVRTKKGCRGRECCSEERKSSWKKGG